MLPRISQQLFARAVHTSAPSTLALHAQISRRFATDYSSGLGGASWNSPMQSALGWAAMFAGGIGIFFLAQNAISEKEVTIHAIQNHQIAKFNKITSEQDKIFNAKTTH